MYFPPRNDQASTRLRSATQAGTPPASRGAGIGGAGPAAGRTGPRAALGTAAITLDDAIARARTNEPTFAAAVAASPQRSARSAPSRAPRCCPASNYLNQYLYTQGARCPLRMLICAANASAQSTGTYSHPLDSAIHRQQLGARVRQPGPGERDHRRAAVQCGQPRLRFACRCHGGAGDRPRGLVASVAGLFYASSTADRRVAVAQRAANEAASLTKLTQQRETAREVAHADVVKAQLQQQQRDRDLADAKLNAEKARLDLAVLLFPDPRTPYTLVVPGYAVRGARARRRGSCARQAQS
jgi:hypothetical protein